MPGIEVPYKRLSSSALEGLIEEFVTREGTDYGHADQPFEKKVGSVVRALESGRAVVLYDEEAGSCNIVTREEFLRRLARSEAQE